MKPAMSLPALAVLAVAAGAAQGLALVQFLGAAAPSADIRTSEATAPAQESSKPANVRELKPIITNLVAPPGAWIRLEAALVFNAPVTAQDEPRIAEVTNDMLAFLRTLSATQLQGASGLQTLREDLVERAGLRTDGKISDVSIETLVIQ
jgi:flagellar protein FliL